MSARSIYGPRGGTEGGASQPVWGGQSDSSIYVARSTPPPHPTLAEDLVGSAQRNRPPLPHPLLSIFRWISLSQAVPAGVVPCPPPPQPANVLIWQRAGVGGQALGL